MRIKNVPQTLGLIPDGNRRWARHNGISFLEGYKQGVHKFIDFADWCAGYGVRNITVWAFSTENFRRTAAEQRILFSIYRKAAEDKEIISRIHENKIRINMVGNIGLLPRDLANTLHKMEFETRNYTERAINMLIAYGGKDDILHAAKELVQRALKSGVSNVNEALFRSYMLSSPVPDIDLVIRTSGEERLSGFMPWQSGYSELYFSNKLWPDFTKRDLQRALVNYDQRQRRFGT